MARVRRRRLVGLAALLGALAVPLACTGGDDDPGLDTDGLSARTIATMDRSVVGDDVGDVTVTGVGGEGTIRLGDYAGTPLVVNFYARWCAPCHEELPALQAVHEELGDQVAFLSISQFPIKESRGMAQELGVTYDLGEDDDRGTALAAVKGVGLPTTVFVRPDGTIADVHAAKLDGTEIRQLIHEHFDPVIDGHFAYAFTVGLLATVNPCGFAMLPAYLSFFLGLESGGGSERRTDVATTVLRALAVGATVSLGFLVVFATIGTLVKVGLDSFIGYVQWATVVIGLGLVALGVAMLLGYHLPFTTPRLDKGGRARSFASVFVFGVSYAVASIGCAMPLFIAAVVGAVGRDGWASGVVAFASYSAGMALVLTTLTLALAFARDSFVQALRTAMRYVDRVAGAFLVLAGGYLAYYWAFNKATDYSTGAGSGPIKWVQERSDAIQARILDDWGYRTVGAVLAAVVLAAVVLVVVVRQRQRRRPAA